MTIRKCPPGRAGRMGRFVAGVAIATGVVGAAAGQGPVMPTDVPLLPQFVPPSRPAYPPPPDTTPPPVWSPPGPIQTRAIVPVQASSPTAPPGGAGPTMSDALAVSPPSTAPQTPPFPNSGFGAPGPSNFSPESVSAGAGTGTGQANPAPRVFEAYWDNGLFFRTQQRDFVAHFGATVQYDGAWYSPGSGTQFNKGGTGPFNDGVNLRRGRIFLEGTFWENFDYKFEMEFFNGFIPASVGTQGAARESDVANSPGPTDAWVQARNVPLVGNVRIGNQKEWFSLEHLNSYRNLEFMERSYLFDFSQPTAFNNGFSPGVSVFRTWADDRVFSAAGAYKNESDLLGFGQGDGNYAVTGRLAALPIWNPEGNRFWHVGGAMSHRDPVNDQVQVRIRDNIRNAPFPLLPLVANTGLVNASSQNLFNVETAGVIDSFTFQAEYTENLIYNASTAAVQNAGTLAYQGLYAEGMYFLTGESRKWDNKNFFFRRVIPNNNFGFTKGAWRPNGWGAWELAARYSYLNLNSQGINGGRLNSATLGLNWYWTPNSKLQFNYDYTYRNSIDPASDGAIHSFGTRMQYDF